MNIEAIKRRLLVKYPLFGSVVANSNFIAESAIETAGTDGKNIYYNPNFIESITDEERTFIFAHEIGHIAFNHIFRSEGKDEDLWNIATDSVLNAFLKQDGLPLVKDGVDIPEASNYDAEEMYRKLLEEKKQQQPNEQDNGQNQKSSQQQSSVNGQSGDDQQSQFPQQGSFSDENQQEQNKQIQEQSGSGSGESSQKKEKRQDVGHDTHSMWAKAIEKRHREEQSQSNSRQSDDFDKKKEQQEKQQPDENQNKEREKNEEIKKLIELGEKEVFKQNKIARKKQLEELREALASKSHGHGDNTNSERRNITDIGTSEPLIDWRRLLKEAIKYDIDWSYQNAGIEDGVVTAYLEEIPRPETEILLDTSGSINETLLRNFLRECKNILQTSKVKVGCFDTQFYGFTEIKNVSDIDNLPFYGGGGTNFDVAVKAFTRRVENKIIFTDGIAKMPSTPIDAIWIVFGGIKINPVGGKVIYINDEQLDRLHSYEMNKDSEGKAR